MFYALIQGIMLVGLLAFTDLQAYTRLEAYRLVPGQILQINMWFFKKWKVGGLRALKETFPNLNTPQYSRLLSGRVNLKRSCAKRRFLFCYHKMVRHRNEYVSECYQQNKVHDWQTCRPVADGAPRRTREKTYCTQGIRRKHEKNLQLVLNKC